MDASLVFKGLGLMEKRKKEGKKKNSIFWPGNTLDCIVGCEAVTRPEHTSTTWSVVPFSFRCFCTAMNGKF